MAGGRALAASSPAREYEGSEQRRKERAVGARVRRAAEIVPRQEEAERASEARRLYNEQGAAAGLAR